MNYEQKYKEVLERAQKELQTCGSADCDAAKQIFRFFPELKESEEEKTRKELIRYLPYCDDISKDTKERWIAWLEKQGDEPNWCHHKVNLSNCSEEYRKAYYDGWYDGWNNCNQQHEQLKAEQKHIVWSKEDKKKQDAIIGILDFQSNKAPDRCCATDGFLLDELIDWLKSLKDRMQPQPKQNWSEEDEYMLNLISNLSLTGYKKHPKIPSWDFIENWLQSIKPNHWKPSEEQLRAIINSAQGLYQCKEKGILLDLYEQLKNL